MQKGAERQARAVRVYDDVGRPIEQNG